MNTLSIAGKNLTRKKIRSILTIGGVAVAVAVLISLLGFDRGYQQSLGENIDRMGYQLLVTAKGCPYEAATLMLKGGGGLRYMEQDVLETIAKDERIDKMTPQLVSSVFDPDRLDGQGGFALYMGINRSYLELKPWSTFQDGGWFSGVSAEEVIMGYEAAEVEQRAVGDEIYIPSVDKVLKVVGIFERTGTQDDGIIFMPLQTAQRIFSLSGKLTGVGIKLKDLHEMAAFEEDMYNLPGIQIISLAQVRGTILNLISSAKVMTNSVAVIAIIIAAIGVINTILMSVFDRTREVGVMKALGASRFGIFKLVWNETILICLFGGLAGIFLALAGSGVVESVLKSVLPYAPSGRLVIINPEMLAGALAGAIFLGIIAGLYPAWRASSMAPVEAIRSGE